MEIGDRVANKALAMEQRKDALAILTEQLAYGVLALKWVEQSPAPAALKEHNATYLTHVASALR